MIQATRHGIVLLILAVGFVDCGGSTTPTMPTAVHQPSYTLSGLTFLETPAGRVPLPGVRVEETNSHRSATSDKEGRYSLAGLHAASHTVSASRWDAVAVHDDAHDRRRYSARHRAPHPHPLWRGVRTDTDRNGSDRGGRGLL